MVHKGISVITASKNWNSVMQQNFETCSENEVVFIWIKHITAPNEAPAFSLTEKSNYLRILEVSCNAQYLESFLFKSLSFLNPEEWCFLIAGDELISSDSLNKLLINMHELNPKIVYGINRLWIKSIGNEYYYSSLPVSLENNFDYQFRIFKLTSVTEDTRIHSPGFKFKKNIFLRTDINLIHLIWEMESVPERIQKIKRYDSISLGAGRGKLRYYLPEVFQESEHSWTKLDPSNQKILNLWKEVKLLEF